MKILYSVYLFVAGGVFYQLIEMAWRCRTHWSMFLLGGACMLSVNLLRLTVFKNMNIVLFCMLGGVAVVLLEFITGYIVNIRLGMAVWDYSQTPLNIMGQICLPYYILWCLLCVPGLWLGRTVLGIFGSGKI